MPTTLVRDLRANLSLGMSDDEFQRGMEGLKVKAPKQGEQVAGAFARSFSRQLGQAFRNLPQAQITADSSDAEVKVNVLRQSLRELANKRIGVDIDATTAMAEMRAIKAELEGLRDTGDIDVRADVTGALAALQVVERQVEKLDGRSIDVDVDIQGAPAALAKIGIIDTAMTVLEASGPLKMAAVAGAIGLLPAAAAAAGSAITVILGGALAGVGLAASMGSAAAQAAIQRLKVAVQTEAAEIGQPFERVWVRIVDVAQRELDTLGPTVRDALADLAPDVETFVDQAGSSLEELAPAVGGVERAFEAVLKSIGPELPEIMHDVADGVTAITDAVEDNPETLTRMALGLASTAEWAGKATAKLIELTKFMQDNAAAFRELFHTIAPATNIIDQLGIGTADAREATERHTQATRENAQQADSLKASLTQLATAYGLVGDDAGAAAQKMLSSWSNSFVQMTSASTVLQQIQTQTRATTSSAERQAAAQQGLADAQRAAAEKIAQAQQRIADAHERAADRIQQADRRVADTRERAAEQATQATQRVADAQQGLADATEQAAQREADAAGRVEDARRAAAQAAEDADRRVEQATQRVVDAQADAADREVDAERRVRDSHERTQQALEDLTAARRRAQEQLEDLAASEADSALDIEAAEVALERARERRDKTNADPTSSALDRREADLAFRQAAQRLEDVKRRGAELKQQIAEATAAGVDGAAEVVQAQSRVAAAQQAEADAEAALAKQRADNVRAVRDAEQGLADALRDAARQQEDAARTVAAAEADLAQVRTAAARDVIQAKREVADAEKEAAKSAVDAARDIRDAEDDARQARRDGAREVAEAEDAMRKARADAARDVVKANQSVKDSWSDLGGSMAVTTEQFLAQLEKQVKDAETWADNLIKLAGRVPPAMLDELVQLGPGGAQVVAMAAGMSDAELRKFIDLYGRSGKAAGDAFADNLSQAAPILAAIARTHGQKVADEIRDAMDHGRTSVFDAARRVGLAIDQGLDLNRTRTIEVHVNTQYGGGQPLAEGGIVFADGGVRGPVHRFASGTERHVAQISGPGTRIWSEPETQGEGYIPLAPSKRPQSERILASIADMFGGTYIRRQPAARMPVMGGDGAVGGWGGGISVGPITLHFADDRDMYAKGQDFAAGLREYVRRGGVLPS